MYHEISNLRSTNGLHEQIRSSFAQSTSAPATYNDMWAKWNDSHGKPTLPLVNKVPLYILNRFSQRRPASSQQNLGLSWHRIRRRLSIEAERPISPMSNDVNSKKIIIFTQANSNQQVGSSLPGRRIMHLCTQHIRTDSLQVLHRRGLCEKALPSYMEEQSSS